MIKAFVAPSLRPWEGRNVVDKPGIVVRFRIPTFDAASARSFIGSNAVRQAQRSTARAV